MVKSNCTPLPSSCTFTGWLDKFLYYFSLHENTRCFHDTLRIVRNRRSRDFRHICVCNPFCICHTISKEIHHTALPVCQFHLLSPFLCNFLATFQIWLPPCCFFLLFDLIDCIHFCHTFRRITTAANISNTSILMDNYTAWLVIKPLCRKWFL